MSEKLSRAEKDKAKLRALEVAYLRAKKQLVPAEYARLQTGVLERLLLLLQAAGVQNLQLPSTEAALITLGRMQECADALEAPKRLVSDYETLKRSVEARKPPESEPAPE